MYRFTEDCLTGIETIDEEHRRLFQLINESIELLKENGASKVIVKNLLKELTWFLWLVVLVVEPVQVLHLLLQKLRKKRVPLLLVL